MPINYLTLKNILLRLLGMAPASTSGQDLRVQTENGTASTKKSSTPKEASISIKFISGRSTTTTRTILIPPPYNGTYSSITIKTSFPVEIISVTSNENDLTS